MQPFFLILLFASDSFSWDDFGTVCIKSTQSRCLGPSLVHRADMVTTTTCFAGEGRRWRFPVEREVQWCILFLPVSHAARC